MALERGRLTNVIVVDGNGTASGVGETVGVITCASNKKVYIKSIMAQAQVGAAVSGTAQVYMVPNGASPIASGATSNQIFNVAMNSGETVLLEPSYPITLTTTGDAIWVGAAHTNVNVMLSGDKEA